MITTRTEKIVQVRYSAPAFDCARRLCVFPPAQFGSQRIIDLQWRCEPRPHAQREIIDDFGNRFLELHHRRIEARFRFEMSLVTARDETQTPRDDGMPPAGLGAYLLPSALCDATPEVIALTQSTLCGANTQDETEIIARLCRAAHDALRYENGATDARTTAGQSLEARRGVCQDYAHLMIALCRTARFAARYVAGYNPSEGQMHAWVEVLCDGAWRAFDPTHNRATRLDCVPVACGRDYRDVRPHTGTFRGLGTARLRAWCKTIVI